MPIQGVVNILDGIYKGLVVLGGSTLVLSLAASGLAMHFAWFDTHMGGLIKRILLSSIGGSSLVGGAGALGLWINQQVGVAGTGAPAVPTPQAGLILGLFGWM